MRRRGLPVLPAFDARMRRERRHDGALSAVFALPEWEVSVQSRPVFDRIEGPKHRLDLSLRPLLPEARLAEWPHGLIGQSFDGDAAPRQGKQDDYGAAVVWTTAQAEGAIEGAADDYRVASPFATEFRFSCFAPAGAKRAPAPAPKSAWPASGELPVTMGGSHGRRVGELSATLDVPLGVGRRPAGGRQAAGRRPAGGRRAAEPHRWRCLRRLHTVFWGGGGAWRGAGWSAAWAGWRLPVVAPFASSGSSRPPVCASWAAASWVWSSRRRRCQTADRSRSSSSSAAAYPLPLLSGCHSPRSRCAPQVCAQGVHPKACAPCRGGGRGVRPRCAPPLGATRHAHPRRGVEACAQGVRPKACAPRKEVEVCAQGVHPQACAILKGGRGER